MTKVLSAANKQVQAPRIGCVVRSIEHAVSQRVERQASCVDKVKHAA